MNNFLIIDLECTCDSPKNLPKDEIEIIEIGAVVGSLTRAGFDFLDRKQIYVKPCIHTRLTTFCTGLTGIEQSVIDSSEGLREVVPLLENWLQKYSPVGWGSWGKFDFNQVRNEFESKGIENPLSQIDHINIKQGFARKHGHRVGLERALSIIDLEFQGRAHSGIDDAKNIGNILSYSGSVREYI